MLSESGFLKENSTHYHNLVTKNICEIYLVSKDIDDQAIYDLVRKYSN